LIGFLDKGASGKDGLGSRENQALRTVRAKRDADEAGNTHLFFHHDIYFSVFRPGVP